MVLFPRWTQLWTGSPFPSPPQEFTRQQPKIFDRPRSQDNTPGRQFSLKLTTTTITMHDGISDWFVMHFGRFPNSLLTGYLGWYFWCISDISEKWGSSLFEKPPEMAGNINYFYLRQQRDLYHYEFQQIEAQLNRLGGRIAYVNAQLTGGANLVRSQRLLERRYYLLQRLKAVEPLLGLNVYAHVDEVDE